MRFLFFLLAGLLISHISYADAGNDFLKSLEGKYSGSGIAKVIGDMPENISCKITSSFEDNTLKTSGFCASLKGKAKISGSITNADGRLKGSFVSSNNVKITKSSGKIEGQKMVLFTTAINEQSGILSRLQQVISKKGSGIEAVFYLYNNKSKKYEKFGSLKLNQR